MVRTFKTFYGSLMTMLISLSAFSVTGYAAGDDMLKPSDVKYEGESANPSNDSGVFIGGGVRFGQARSTESDVSPGTGWLLFVEPGYQAGTGIWNRFEFGAQLLTGALNFNESDANGGDTKIKIKYGVLARAGWGYSLGNRIMGVLKAGVGPVAVDMEMKSAGTKATADNLTGLAAELGYELVVPMNDALDFNAGIEWTHIQYNVDEVKVGSVTWSGLDRDVHVNMPSLQLGVRARL